MKNPWHNIPLADYESHMALPDVAQAQLLADVFADSLDKYLPQSVAVLGCAGGNGFDRISANVTERVVGIDLNPDYIRQLRARFDHRVPNLELFVGDVQTDEFAFSSVKLVFAALVFEYVDPDAVLLKVRSMLRDDGVLLAVLQLPTATIPEVTPSPFPSLDTLSSVMRLVPPDRLRHLASARGYIERDAQLVVAAGGKQFQVLTFCVETPHLLGPPG